MAKKAKLKENNYQAIYLVIGLLTAFFSVVALCNWGFIGALFMNTFRLFVGEAYDLVFIFLLFYALSLVINGNAPKTTWKQFFGVTLILISITSILHMREFYPRLTPDKRVFQETYAIFKNELVTSQKNLNMGGGMLGACGYITFGYLFGSSGNMLLSGILFFFGIMLAFDLEGRLVIQSFRKIIDSVTSAMQDFSDTYEKKSQEAKARRAQELINQEEITEDTPSDTVDQNSENTESNWSSWLKLWKPRKEREKRARNNDIYSTDYEPSYKGPSPDYLDEANNTAKETTTASRQKVVLDLDYFDKEDQEKGEGQEVVEKPAPVEIVTGYSEQVEKEPAKVEAELDAVEKVEPIIVDDTPSMDTKVNHPTIPAEELEAVSPESVEEIEVQAEKEPVNSDGSGASHWQDQASVTHSLTDDGIDQVLHSSNSQPTKVTKPKKTKNYQLPPKSLLNKIEPVDQSDEYEQINRNIAILDQTFASFNVDAKVVKANLGPAVTKYEVEPGVGVKVSRIVNLADDIALALAARDVRIEAPIPGKSRIGIEVPNRQVSPVAFSEVVDAGLNSEKILEVPLGRDVSGAICMADLAKMPHLLIAGATGSGKSVGINVIICSILMKAKPEEVKLLLIDPKKVELALYDEIPHLVSPVVTNPRKAAQALNKIVKEMEDRYELFAQLGVRNADGYNEQIDKYNAEHGTGYKPLPKIVVIIDELADLMMVASSDVENAIIRLAQMARAAGIHMVIATQRPSVDVITGIIKANIPSRLAFAVTSGTDSRTILDSNGAEKLLGRGDMLFQPMGRSQPLRVQGAYISDEEVERITNFIKEQAGPDYDEDMMVTEEESEIAQISDDEYFQDAIEFIKGEETVSISQLQRKFRIGYNRAARIVDDLEALGLVSEQDGSRPRDVLIEGNKE